MRLSAVTYAHASQVPLGQAMMKRAASELPGIIAPRDAHASLAHLLLALFYVCTCRHTPVLSAPYQSLVARNVSSMRAGDIVYRQELVSMPYSSTHILKPYICGLGLCPSCRPFSELPLKDRSRFGCQPYLCAPHMTPNVRLHSNKGTQIAVARRHHEQQTSLATTNAASFASTRRRPA